MKDSEIYIKPLVAALAVAIAPHVLNMPFWITVWCLVLWGYAWRSAEKRRPPPPDAIRRLLVFIGLVGVVAGSGTRFTGSFYIGLLAVMSGLKVLEIRNHRDLMVTAFIAYFIVIASLFESESLGATVYMMLSVLVTTSAMIRLNNPKAEMKKNLKLSAKIMVQAIPLMILLFLLFPRFHRTIWGFSPQRATSGFTDNIEPGNVSSLVKNNQIAFRAEFKGKIPAPEQLYWRGIVFWDFDGRRWRRGDTPLLWEPAKGGGDFVEYVTVLEPHGGYWVFALDLPAAKPFRTRILADHTIISRRVIARKTRFEMKSALSHKIGRNLLRWEERGLRLPEDGNPKARQLAAKWYDEFDDSVEIVREAMNYFKKNGFVYSLKPPLLGDDSVDDFLFSTRKGYCEHYASAFAFLMREAGVPCRLVGGYLGGMKNPYGNYLIVRQSDAHVWAEVWIENKGWSRVDPTYAVAPERIEAGIEDALPDGELPGFLSLDRFGPLSQYIRKIMFGWDAVSNLWDIWFSAYSFQQQMEFLSKIGIRAGSWIGVAKALFLAVVFTGLAAGGISIWIARRKPAHKKNHIRDTYLKFCQKLEEVGISRAASEGPIDFAATAGNSRKDLRVEIGEITDLYVFMRYGRGGGQENLKKFEELVKRFDPVAPAR